MRAQFAFKMFMIRARSFLHKAQNHQRGGGSQKRHAPVGLIVLVLHGMGVWAWWTSGTQSRATRQAEAITRVTLTLPAPERPAVTKSTPGKRSQAPSSILAHQRAPSSAQAVALPTDPAPTVAPAEPSGQDRQVAAQASRMASDARMEIARREFEQGGAGTEAAATRDGPGYRGMRAAQAYSAALAPGQGPTLSATA